jgi:uncharacterized membrane protein
MSNPFDVPQTGGGGHRSGGAPATFDLMQAFRDGADATARNGISWFGVLIVAGLLTALSILFCIVPVLVIGPVMSWGSYKFALQAVDGDAEFGVLFEGFERLGEIVLPMLGLGLLLALVSAPGVIAGQVLSSVSFFTDDQTIVLLASLIGFVVQVVWGVVVGSRFTIAYFLLIDGAAGPLDALTQSWNLTASCWPQAMGLQLLAFPLMMAGALCCFIGMIPAAMVILGAQASMYRQLTAQS